MESGLRLELGVASAAVRRWRPEDAEALVPHADDRRVWLNLRDRFPHPYRPEDARRFLEHAVTVPSWFAIEVEGGAAGAIGYEPGTDVERVGAELGYWLGAAHWGRGIVTAAVRAVVEHAFGAEPVLQRLFALPFAGNLASARVLEKAGFQREGTLRSSALKDGKLLDQWMYARLRP
jgi:RimJ/RimL family protein N-acetyltransferase